MTTVVSINDRRVKGKRDIMLYGHFIEHFHRQIYDGIFDPGNPLSDEDGFRTDIIDAMKKIRVPILGFLRDGPVYQTLQENRV